MKKIITAILGIILIINVLGCNKENIENKNGESIKTNEQEKDEIVLWSYYPWDGPIKEFEEANPGKKIKQVIIPYDGGKYSSKYLEALIGEEAPDIMILDSNDFGAFNTIDAFENLYSEDYNLEKYLEHYDKELLSTGLSLNEKKLLGLPFASAPLLTFYREDILRENNLPSDPEELGVYMEKPENWVNIAEVLKKKGSKISNWVTDPFRIYDSSEATFNEDLEYIKNKEKIKSSINISKELKEKALLSYLDIWRENGQAAIKNGEIAMVYLGSWGADQLEKWVPEQKGKWRVTRLPFNVYGWTNSSIMSIPQKSKNKKLAWEFIEHYTFKTEKDNQLGTVHGYKPLRNNEKAVNHKNEFLGGQKDQELYEKLMDETKEHKITPLDKKAFEITTEAINNGLESDLSIEEIYNNIQDDIDLKLKEEKEIILSSINKNK